MRLFCTDGLEPHRTGTSGRARRCLRMAWPLSRAPSGAPLAQHPHMLGRWLFLCQVVPALMLAACGSDVDDPDADNEFGTRATGHTYADSSADAGNAINPSVQAPLASQPQTDSEQHLDLAHCQDLSRQALKFVLDAAESEHQCLEDFDCHAYSDQAALSPCWDSCGSPQWGSVAQEAVVRQALSSPPVRSACALFFDSGCRIVPSGCPYSPPGRRCVANACIE